MLSVLLIVTCTTALQVVDTWTDWATYWFYWSNPWYLAYCQSGNNLYLCIMTALSRGPTRTKRKKPRRKSMRYYSRTRTKGKIRRKRREFKTLQHVIAYVAQKQCAAQTNGFDPDAYMIGIDNHASACMTNDKADFVSKLEKVNVRVKGIAGKLLAAY